MKKIITMIVATAVMISMSVAPGYAGSRNRHLAQGILIGAGAVILGAALANEIRHDSRVCVNVSPPNRYSRHQRVERVWVEPRYERRWNPGHYNQRGHWVKGQYQMVIVSPGFWEVRPNRGRY